MQFMDWLSSTEDKVLALHRVDPGSIPINPYGSQIITTSDPSTKS